tara:strand:- start:5493 stop:6452 length:960 start_codon:yes stop_codon:yes gene_type:complete
MNNNLSKLGLGGATFGNVLADGIFGGVNQEKAIEIINYAYESGIKIFDTAPLYGFGRSELWYGRALSGIKRGSINLTSKCGRLIRNLRNKNDSIISDIDIDKGYGEPVFDYSRDGIRRSVEESLARLKTDYLDTLLLHDPDQGGLESEAYQSAFPEMAKMKEEGIVKNVGCGMNECEMPIRFMKKIDLDKILLAGRYTLLENTKSSEFMKICAKKNVKVIIGGPYNSGILARDLNSPVSYDYEVAPPKLIKRAKDIEEIANKFNVSLKSASLNFVLMNSQVFSVVPGMSSINEVKDNIDIANENIPIELWSDLSENGFI